MLPGQIERDLEVERVAPAPKRPRARREAAAWTQPALDLGPLVRVPRRAPEPEPPVWPPFQLLPNDDPGEDARRVGSPCGRSYRRRMRVELLWSRGCPNWRETDDRLREALRLAGAAAEAVLVQVATPEEAERLRFRGSPTVLIDGADPFAEESDPVGLSCRVFRTAEGLRGAPTLEQLVEALRAAA